jgi:DNA-binding HxlR family transcriptional regulator
MAPTPRHDAHVADGMSPSCPHYQRAMEIIARPWTPQIVRAMLAGTTRFSAFTAAIPGLSDRLLSQRLKALEAEDVLVRSVLADRPVRIEYGLTEKGRALGAAIEALSEWAEIWVGEDAAGARREPEAESVAGARPPATEDRGASRR